MGNGAFKKSSASKVPPPTVVPPPEVDVNVSPDGSRTCEEEMQMISPMSYKSSDSRRSAKHTIRISVAAPSTPSSGSKSPPSRVTRRDVAAMEDPATRAFLSEVMKRHFVFSELEESEHSEVLRHMHKIEMKADDVVFNEGDVGDSCYFIRSGVFSVKIENKDVKQIKAGETFGELALLYSMLRSATITCVVSGELWEMDNASFRLCMSKLSSTQVYQATTFFNADPNFSSLSEDDRRLLASLCVMQHYSDGDVILREGEIGQWMLIVIAGSIGTTHDADAGCTSSAGAVCKLGGLGFKAQRRFDAVLGGVGVLYGKRQAFGVKAEGPVTCLAVAKSAFAKLTPSVEAVLRRCSVQALLLGLIPPRGPASLGVIFGNLSDGQQHRLAGLTNDVTFENNQVIMRPGDPAQLIIIIDGEVALMPRIEERVEDNGTVLCNAQVDVRGAAEQVISDAMGHGEVEMFSATPMACFAVALGRVRLLRLTHASVVEELGYPLCELARRSQVKRVLSDIFLFKNLREEQLDRAVTRMAQHSFATGSVIVQQDDHAEHFYLIQSGSISVRRGGNFERTLSQWDYFGERGLLLSEKRSATCEAIEDCVCLVLQADVFFEIVGMFRGELERRMRLQDPIISMADLEVEAVVGRGSFGLVRLVHPKGQASLQYALKGVRKIMVIKHNQEKSILMEREVNAECNHPCVSQFVKTFQDKQCVYFLTEFLGGGDLFTIIRDIGVLSKEQIHFFSGSIILGMEYIHSRGIIYRDLKPENVLLNFEGRAKLVDFGCCTRQTRTYSLVGTPEYLAPEVILGKGYMNSVDWWALGVMMYEFIAGPLPFGADSEDQMATFKSVLEDTLSFSEVDDEISIAILKGLINRDPHRRLGGSVVGAKEIKDQAYFDGFDWEALSGGFMTPPYKPNVEAMRAHWSPADVESFDNTSSEQVKFPRGMEWAKVF